MGQRGERSGGRGRTKRKHPEEPRRKAGWKQRVVIAQNQVFAYLQHHKCVEPTCPESDPVVLQFDHVRGKKRCSISALVHVGAPWTEIQEEIEKCDVRCANCHQRRHAKEGRFFIYRKSCSLL